MASPSSFPAPSAPVPALRFLRPLLWLLAVYFALRYLVLNPLAVPPSDFQIYYGYAHEARAGRNPFIDLTPGDATAGYAYPLFLMTVLVPLSHLPLAAAEKVWWALNALCAVAGAWVALAYWRRRALPQSPLSRLRIAPPALLCLIFGFLPLAETLRLGQANIPVVALLGAAAALGAARRRVAAGIAFALAVLIKAQPILLLPAMLPLLGWTGLAATASVGVLYLLALLATGAWQWEWYLWTVKMPLWAAKPDATTVSLYHSLIHLWGLPPAAALRWASGIEALLWLLYLGGLLWLWRRRAAPVWLLCWAVPCVLLLSRFLEFHHLLWLAVPIVVLLVEGDRARRPELLTLSVATFALANFGYVLRNLSLPLAPEYAFYAALLVCACAALRAALASPAPATLPASSPRDLPQA